MNLQELINDSELDMTLPQMKAFFLGILCADRPMPFNLAVDELLLEFSGDRAPLEAELKKLWDEMQADRRTEMENLFASDGEFATFLERSKEQLDYFLTGMSLSGTSVESCANEDLAEVIDELEDIVEDLEDYLSEEKQSKEEGEELKEFLLEAWNAFIEVRL